MKQNKNLVENAMWLVFVPGRFWKIESEGCLWCEYYRNGSYNVY